MVSNMLGLKMENTSGQQCHETVLEAITRCFGLVTNHWQLLKHTFMQLT